ncbi:MAG: hypothetical protein JW913_01570 [Chitinispirillaceae bacterium]|nr:hypothetical protein [Chitinispirillaceae bacterium]
MPRRDGTGPFGTGFGAGRGRGPCKKGYEFGNGWRMVFRDRGGWLLGMAVPVVAAAIRDAVNPSGLLRRIVRQALPSSTGGRPRTVTDAQYTVVREQPVRRTSEPQPEAKEGRSGDA